MEPVNKSQKIRNPYKKQQTAGKRIAWKMITSGVKDVPDICFTSDLPESEVETMLKWHETHHNS